VYASFVTGHFEAILFHLLPDTRDYKKNILNCLAFFPVFNFPTLLALAAAAVVQKLGRVWSGAHDGCNFRASRHSLFRNVVTSLLMMWRSVMLANEHPTASIS
jgi:hypothetical protein